MYQKYLWFGKKVKLTKGMITINLLKVSPHSQLVRVTSCNNKWSIRLRSTRRTLREPNRWWGKSSHPDPNWLARYWALCNLDLSICFEDWHPKEGTAQQWRGWLPLWLPMRRLHLHYLLINDMRNTAHRQQLSQHNTTHRLEDNRCQHRSQVGQRQQ